ncbi:MAG: homoserine kinase [Leptonema sp. (in: Bacteria)]|nr:homoserine kinase [Leptonema sp. (in: bacteria)]
MTVDIVLRIPATSANLGPGFDIFGLAISLSNIIGFSFSNDANYQLTDTVGKELPISQDQNLIRIGYQQMYQKLGGQNPPKWNAIVNAATTPGKGFGSSAMAIVAGVHLAWAILRAGGVDSLLQSVQSEFSKTDKNELYPESHGDEIAGFLDLEPHPDNVVPARLGGWVFCSDPQNVIRYNLPNDLGLIALIPDYSISTEKSRVALPATLSRADALMNIRGCLLWLEYIHTGRTDLLIQALQSDRLHEPYRTPNLIGYQELKLASQREGCYGMTLSGSGPGIIVYYDKKNESKLMPRIKALAVEHLGPSTIVHSCQPDKYGLTYIKEMAKTTLN